MHYTKKFENQGWPNFETAIKVNSINKNISCYSNYTPDVNLNRSQLYQRKETYDVIMIKPGGKKPVIISITNLTHKPIKMARVSTRPGTVYPLLFS